MKFNRSFANWFRVGLLKDLPNPKRTSDRLGRCHLQHHLSFCLQCANSIANVQIMLKIKKYVTGVSVPAMFQNNSATQKLNCFKLNRIKYLFSTILLQMLKHVHISPQRSRADLVSLRSSTSCASSLCGSPEPTLDSFRSASRASSFYSLNDEATPQVKFAQNILQDSE